MLQAKTMTLLFYLCLVVAGLAGLVLLEINA